MEIKIDRDKLLKSVSKVQSIIERKSTMPILSTILLAASGSTLHISATDLELGFQQKIDADIIKEGIITISGKTLFEILKESKKEKFHIREKENNWVFISDGSARYNLACLPADEYPSLVEPEGLNTVEVNGEALSEMITKTIFSVNIEDTGFKLSGVFTEKIENKGEIFLRMVSTDGHRLSMIDKVIPEIEKLDLEQGVMLPKKGLSELNKLASEGEPVQIGFKQKTCVAKRKNTLLLIRLLESHFPDYHAIIEEPEFTFPINRLSLLEVMRKMLIISNERYRSIKITLENNSMDIVSINPDLGEAQETIQIEYHDKPLVLGFNARYFVDTLNVMKSEIVILGFIDNSKPCIITGDSDTGFLGMIMPMRL